MWQPWASLWLSRNKPYETRHWPTTHRGQLLVHATKKFVRDVEPVLARVLKNEFGAEWSTDLPTGAIIGMVDLIDVVSVETICLKGLDPEQQACGDFSPGRFGWRRGSYWLFREPIPYRGHQTLFNVSLNTVAAQLAASAYAKG